MPISGVDERRSQEPQALSQVRRPHRKERRLPPHAVRSVQNSHLLALPQGTEFGKFGPVRQNLLRIED